MSTYIGWIPNLIGNISYTLIGRSKYPNKADYCIFKYEDTFHYVISQRRITHDSQRLPKITSLWSSQRILESNASFLKEKGITSTWDAVLIGKCESESTDDKNHQSLKGKVFFIPSDKENDIVSTVRDISRKSRDDEAQAISCKETLEADISNKSKLSCEFELNRNGFCSLSKLSLKQSNAAPSSQFALTENKAYDQCFFFLKDIFHTHKFHRPEYDTLTQTYPVNENAKWSWAKETLKVLYRTAIRTEPEEAIGIIYYARTLKDIVKNSNEQQSIEDGFSFLDKNSISDKHAEDVCKSRIDAKKRTRDERKWLSGLVSAATLMAWTKSSPDFLKDNPNALAINLIIYFAIAWCVLIYVKNNKVSLSEKWQMIKFSNYLLSIDKSNQLKILIKIGLLGLIMIIGLIAFLLLF